MKTPSNYARSLRFAGLVTMIATATAVQACSSDKIVAGPSSVTRSPAPSAPSGPSAASTQLRVAGTVTDDAGAPVAGVKVTVYTWSNGLSSTSALTDDMGIYTVSFASAAGISAFTEKVGYESKWHTSSASATGYLKFDLRIQRARH